MIQKFNLLIAWGCAVICTKSGKHALSIAHEGVWNKDGAIALASECQTCNMGDIVDSIAKHHVHWDGSPGRQAVKLVSALMMKKRNLKNWD